MARTTGAVVGKASMPAVGYELLVGAPVELGQLVEKYLSKGWELYGSPFRLTEESKYDVAKRANQLTPWVAQAVVRYVS